MRRLVGTLCVAQAVRHVDPAGLEAVDAARLHLAIAGVAAHRKDLHGSGHCLAVVVVEHVDSAERKRDAAFEPASQLISAETEPLSTGWVSMNVVSGMSKVVFVRFICLRQLAS